MKNGLKLLAAALLLVSPLRAQPQIQIPESGATVLNPRVQDFLRDYGKEYNLAVTPEGALVYTKANVATGKLEAESLSPEMSQKILQMLAKLPPKDFEAAMAQSLRSYLQSRPLPPKVSAQLFEKAADGSEKLTPLGRNVLMDILTAEDGRGFKPQPDKAGGSKDKKEQAMLESASRLAMSGFKNGGLGGSGFDGSRAFTLESFDWAGVGAQGAGAPQFKGYAVDGQKGTVRLMIAAPNNVASDRLVVQDPNAEADQIYKEAGLDPALLAGHQATVVRAMDNLVTVDVPVAQAAGLGKALGASGVSSRPARLMYAAGAAADAMARPAWRDPLFSILPVPSATFEGRGLFGAKDVRPMNEGSRDILHIGGLWNKGMTGRGSVVGIIDSGLDVKHPDFKDRVVAYIDLTNTGLKDSVAHGTHVAGSIGGDGSASQGRYKGMAPDTKFVIIKVFGNEGSTSEDTIVAAMKAAKSLPPEIRPNVINMSLGGPGDPDSGPLSQMANQMMVKDNIVMAVAAGNEGPSKGTIGSPGNARYVLTVTGVNKEQKFSFFPSRGPVTDSRGRTYSKPDISTVAGDVSAAARRKAFWGRVIRPFASSAQQGLFPKPMGEGGNAPKPNDPSCFYAPGVISARSSDDGDTGCAVAGNPNYRYMTGTSMASPMAAGIAADAVGYMNEKGHAYKAAEVKALMMETATDLKQPSEVQGAGLVNGDKMAAVLADRVGRGLPVGNVAYMFSQRLSRWDEFNMKQDKRFEKTDLGIVDTKTQHLVNTDVDFEAAVDQVEARYKSLPWYSKAIRKVKYWWEG